MSESFKFLKSFFGNLKNINFWMSSEICTHKKLKICWRLGSLPSEFWSRWFAQWPLAVSPLRLKGTKIYSKLITSGMEKSIRKHKRKTVNNLGMNLKWSVKGSQMKLFNLKLNSQGSFMELERNLGSNESWIRDTSKKDLDINCYGSGKKLFWSKFKTNRDKD